MKKVVSIFILGCFFVTSIMGPSPVYAQEFRLPVPGVMVHLSPEFNPPILKGIKVHPENPFRFDFILDQGDEKVGTSTTFLRRSFIKQESTRLIKYFLASLTIPEKDLWVNLSPYEKNRIVPDSFGQTEMGRDLLAEDYMLKQITASLIYPEDKIGKEFWKRIYEEASKKFGTTNIPVNTFNKVWIVPEKAVVYENARAGTAYIVESKLKVMLEQDYLALEKSDTILSQAKDLKMPSGPSATPRNDVNALGSQIVREIVIPELTKEINEDKNFSQLRQVYNSLILATWYKKKIKDSILAQVYSDKNKIAGVGYKNFHSYDIEVIYQRYLQAFKKGAFNFIKEESDPITRVTIPKKYFSGGMGFNGAQLDRAEIFTTNDAGLPNMVSTSFAMISANVKAETVKSVENPTTIASPGQRDQAMNTNKQSFKLKDVLPGYKGPEAGIRLRGAKEVVEYVVQELEENARQASGQPPDTSVRNYKNSLSIRIKNVKGTIDFKGLRAKAVAYAKKKLIKRTKDSNIMFVTNSDGSVQTKMARNFAWLNENTIRGKGMYLSMMLDFYSARIMTPSQIKALKNEDLLKIFGLGGVGNFKGSSEGVGLATSFAGSGKSTAGYELILVSNNPTVFDIRIQKKVDNSQLTQFSEQQLEAALERLANGPTDTSSDEVLRYWTHKDMQEVYGKAFNLDDGNFDSYFGFLVTSFRVLYASPIIRQLTLKRVFIWRSCLPMAYYLIHFKKAQNLSTVEVGINGMVGLGKTTFSGAMSKIMSILADEQAINFSLDDLYYPKKDREAKGLTTFGPGNHDIALGEKALVELKHSSDTTRVALPVFDKSVRDRSPTERIVAGKVSFVFFEGFTVGSTQQGYEALEKQLDLLITFEGNLEKTKEWRKAQGWKDQAGFYGGDYARFSEDFEKFWSAIEQKAASMLPEILPRSNFVVSVAEGHSWALVTQNPAKELRENPVARFTDTIVLVHPLSNGRNDGVHQKFLQGLEHRLVLINELWPLPKFLKKQNFRDFQESLDGTFIVPENFSDRVAFIGGNCVYCLQNAILSSAQKVLAKRGRFTAIVFSQGAWTDDWGTRSLEDELMDIQNKPGISDAVEDQRKALLKTWFQRLTNRAIYERFFPDKTTTIILEFQGQSTVIFQAPKQEKELVVKIVRPSEYISTAKPAISPAMVTLEADFGKRMFFDIKDKKLLIDRKEVKLIGEGGRNFIFNTFNHVAFRIYHNPVEISPGEKDGFEAMTKLGRGPQVIGEGFTSNGYYFFAVEQIEGSSLDHMSDLNRLQWKDFKQMWKELIDNMYFMEDAKPQQFMYGSTERIKQQRWWVADAEMVKHRPDMSRNQLIDAYIQKLNEHAMTYPEDWKNMQIKERLIKYLESLKKENKDTMGNPAQIARQAKTGSNAGGIDLTSNKVLQIKNDGKEEIKFHLDPALLRQLQNAPGFVPVIINIQPMINVRKFLGIIDPVVVDKSA